METVNLGARVREKTGKQKTKDVRRRGCIPAVLYGHGMTPVSLEVESRELLKALHTKAGSNVLISLNVADVKLKESTCVIKAIQHNPVTDGICHVDFTVISMTEKITVSVPVVIKNAVDAAGVKEGGVLEVIHHEIEVECLPTAIPEKFEIDAKDMNLGDILYVKDMVIPSDVTCKLALEEAVVAIHAPREEAVAAEGEAAVQPEVIEKGKKLEEGTAEEAAPAAADKGAEKKAEKK